jgi:TolB protein
LIASWEITKIIPDADLDSSEHLSVSRNGEKLIMDVGMENGESMKNFDGPPPAIWLFEIESGKTTRLTPKGSYAYSPCWLNDTEYLFLDQDKKETSICRAPVAGGPRKLVVRNGTEQSVSW